MLQKIRERTAQSTLEYAVLAVVIIGALLSVQTYLKRGVMGKLKSSSDDISSEQYDPAGTTYTKTTNTFSSTREVSNAGTTNTELLAEESTNVSKVSTTEIDSSGGIVQENY